MSNARRLAYATTWLIAFSGVVASGCGGDTDDAPPGPVDQCNDVAKAECARIFQCTTDLERQQAGLPAGFSEASCIFGGAAQLGCAQATAEKICAGPQPNSAAQAKACIAEVNRADCATIKSNYPRVQPYAPSCGQCAPMLSL